MAFYVKHASLSNTRHTGGARPRRKGDRIEREIVRRHIALGLRSERYPLSGASQFRGGRRPMSDISNNSEELEAYLLAEFRCAALCNKLATAESLTLGEVAR